MKVIKNKYIPPKGFAYIMLFGVLFTRRDNIELSKTSLAHETIHTYQMKELLYVGFYLLYILEYIIKFPFAYFYKCDTYYSLSFEQEAYTNEKTDLYTYKLERKKFNWIKYLFKLKMCHK